MSIRIVMLTFLITKHKRFKGNSQLTVVINLFHFGYNTENAGIATSGGYGTALIARLSRTFETLKINKTNIFQKTFAFFLDKIVDSAQTDGKRRDNASVFAIRLIVSLTVYNCKSHQ